MTANQKRVAVACASIAIIGFGIWLSGWNPERGATAVFILLYSTIAVAWAASFPFGSD